MYYVIRRVNISTNQIKLPALLGARPSQMNWDMAGETLCDKVVDKIKDIIEKDPESVFVAGVLYPMEFSYIEQLCREKNITLLIVESDAMYKGRPKATVTKASVIYIYWSRKVTDKETYKIKRVFRYLLFCVLFVILRVYYHHERISSRNVFIDMRKNVSKSTQIGRFYTNP